MINTNDLRRGNWISFDGVESHQVQTITPDAVGVNSDDGHDHFQYFSEDRIHGIPITEEILLKNGIGKYFDGQTEVHFNGDIIGDNRNRTNFVYYKLERSWFYKHFGREIPCKYVHKFQNIYHVLYEEEYNMVL